MAKINILQIGEENWNEIYTTPEYVTLDLVDSLIEAPENAYDIFFLDRDPLDAEVEQLFRSV